MEEVRVMGKGVAAKAKGSTLRPYQRGPGLLRQRGLILVDTKCEFGWDDRGCLHVIDEVNGRGSSRRCSTGGRGTKFPKIAGKRATGEHEAVSDVLKAKPEPVRVEFPKQH
eukprot:1196385-Lingulodinium_polyedra.AAC.1